MATYKELLLTGPEAICILDSNLNITQHNNAVAILLGERDKDLTGLNIRDIIYSDSRLIELLSSDVNTDWLQGQCVMKTFNDAPLLVKFRASKVSEPELNNEAFVIAFRQLDRTQIIEQTKQALNSLINSLSKRDVDLKGVITDFVKSFDQDAVVEILPALHKRSDETDLDQTQRMTDRELSAINLSISKRKVIFYTDKGPGCVIPISSNGSIDKIAWVRFSKPRPYSDVDRAIFDLAGLLVGKCLQAKTAYERSTSIYPLFLNILHEMGWGVVVVDSKGIVVDCNEEFESIYRYTKQEIVGNSLLNLILTADSEEAFRKITEGIAKGKIVMDEKFVTLRKDWTLVDVSISAFPYESADTRDFGAVLVIKDLTTAHNIKHRLSYCRKLLTIGELISSVANELNNLNTTIIGYLRVLLQEGEAQSGSVLSRVYNEAKKLDNILLNIFEFGRESFTNKELVDVIDVLSSVVSFKENQLKASSISVDVTTIGRIPRVLTDRHGLYLLFLRLINYAEQRIIQFGKEGNIKIEVASQQGKVIIRISDNGTLIVPADMESVINPFSSLCSLDVGYDLDVDIIDDLGATLRLECDFGRSNDVIIEFPVTEPISDQEVSESELKRLETEGFRGDFEIESKKLEEGTDETKVPAPKVETDVELPKQFTGRVMIVDDNPNIIDLLTRILRSLDLETDVAQDGNIALEKLSKGNYDLIISDLKMPGGFTGDRLYKFIKRRDRRLAERIIFMTGDVISAETNKFLKSTGNYFLEKPFLPETLVKIVQELLKSDSKRG